MSRREISTDNLQFGMSLLHGWVRMLEWLLYFAYILYYQSRSGKLEEKASIQREFRERCGLIVDQPIPGFSNVISGNIAGRLFQNPELCAEIINIDRD
ncbi:hypothetical protein PR048_004907, partial [Dryococelus australis]